MAKLLLKYTTREEVVDGLIFLFTEGALLWTRESSPGQSASCPAAVMSHQTKEELAFFFQSPGSSNGQISCLVQSILAWKVDLVANCPEASNCHLCTSSTSSCNITSWTKSHTARNSKRTATEWWLFLVLLSFEFGCRSSLVMLCSSLIMMIRMKGKYPVMTWLLES